MALIGSFDRLYHSFVRTFNAVCRSEGYDELTVNNYQYVVAIHTLGDPSVTELAKHLGVKKPSVTNMLDALEMMGYVDTQETGADRRGRRVRLSEKGIGIMRLENATSAALVDRLSRVLDAEELVELERLVDKMVRGIEAGA